MAKVFNDDLELNLEQCNLWQYDQATNIQTILNNELEFYNINVTQFWKNFYTNIFNIKTANDFGLSLWGVTLGIPRPKYVNSQGETIPFSTEQYRTLLRGALLLMNSTASVHDVNMYLESVFPNKPVFCADTHDQTMVLNFFYDPEDEELAIIDQDQYFPRPAGVNKRIQIFNPETTFGFNGSGLGNFDNGTFWV